MRKDGWITLLLLMFLIAACNTADSSHSAKNAYKEPLSFKEEETDKAEMVQAQKEEEPVKMKLEIGEHIFIAVLEENSSADALKEWLKDGPLTLNMTDYANMEKNADLKTVLPQNNVQMQTEAGDIILYQGRTLVIYYEPNSWSLTPIGKIENVDPAELRRVLGTGDVTVIISLE